MSAEDKKPSNIKQANPQQGLSSGSTSDRPADSNIKQANPSGGLKTGSLSDRPENSNIKQASPQSGLQTGSIKDNIAAQYEPALSGSEGPRARFDTLRELINTEIGANEAGKVVSSSSGASLEGFGQFLVLNYKRDQNRGKGYVEEEIAPSFGPWDIITSGEEFGIAVGTIYKSFGSVNDADTFTITDFDLTFTPSATTVVYLELGNLSTPTITLKAGAAWAEHPETFKLTTTGVVKAEKAFFRLWHGVSGNKPANAFGIQYDGFWMKKTFRSNDLVLGYGSYELDDTHRHIAVPVLFPM